MATLIAAKTRVTPVGCLTAPRSELNAIVLGTRLLDSVLRAYQSRIRTVHILSDSQCAINSVNTERGTLATYFHNRVSKVRDVMEWSRLYPEMVIQPPAHVPGILNTADLGTRGKVAL